jgi:O-antigen/teichoic acid export membrane protein
MGNGSLWQRRAAAVTGQAGMAEAADSSGEILRRTAKGAGWIVGWRMATRALGLCSTLILARLLLPADFGLVALATAFITSIDALSVLGVDDALIRIENPRRALYDTAFTINLIRGVATATLLLILGGPIGAFFNDPRLANVLFALAAGSVISGGHNIGTIDFRREIVFHKEFKLFVIPRLVSVATTVTCAIVFRSYWALVAGILTGRVLLAGYSYVLHPFRPRLTLSAWHELAGISFWTWLLSIVGLIRDRTDSFFIGYALDARAVGMFSVATEIASLPSTELVIPLGTATFAGFAAARHAGASSGDTYLRVIGVVSSLTLPAGIGISLLADPVVRLALGPNWLQAIPVIEVAAVLGSLTVFGIISSSLFNAHAFLSVLFRVSLASMALRVALLAWLVPAHGIMGATAASGLGMVFEYSTYVVLTCRRFALSAPRFLARIWRSALATAVMAGGLVAMRLGWVPHPGTPAEQMIRLAEGSLAGAAIYTATLVALWAASGRPNGPETDLLGFAASLIRKFRPAAALQT